MKKYLLSSFVIASFLIYSFIARKTQDSAAIGAVFDTPTPSPSSTPVATGPTPSATPDSNLPPTPVPTPVSTPTPAPRGMYKDGTFTGDVADAFYGNIQVAAVIQGGKLADVTILQYPNDRGRSIQINTYALPILRSEAIQAQSGSVDGVSGATDSSQAFRQSLTSALQLAKS